MTEKNELKYKTLYILCNAAGPLSTTEISNHIGVNRRSLSVLMSKWASWAYVCQHKYEISPYAYVYQYSIAKKGREFVQNAPLFMDTGKLMKEMFLFQKSAGIIT
jgi:hypothetical protein